MKLKDISIDGFGKWSGLKLDRFEDGLNVVYGRNESGKTTILEFLRGVMYGFPDKRRKQYFPPLHGGGAGGQIVLQDGLGKLTVRRHDNGDAAGRLDVQDDRGERRSGEALLRRLGEVNEEIFNQVFAVGLDEIQELRSLSDEDVAHRLYDLASGLEGTSLTTIMRRLRQQRDGLLGVADGEKQTLPLDQTIPRLIAKREELRRKLHEPAAINQRYAGVSAQRRTVEEKAGKLEQDIARVQHDLRMADMAFSLRDKWVRRIDLGDQIRALGPERVIPADACEKVEKCKARADARRQQVQTLKKKQVQCRAQIQKIGVNERLVEHAAQIRGLLDLKDWIATLEKRIEALQEDQARLEVEITNEAKQIGVEARGGKVEDKLTDRMLARLKAIDRKIKSLESQHEDLTAQARQRENALQATLQEHSVLLEGRTKADVADAIEETHTRIGLLEQRVQVEERIERLETNSRELDETSMENLEQDLLPVRGLYGLGILFAAGVMLILGGMFFQPGWTGGLGWVMALLGLAGVATVVGVKWTRDHDRRLEMDSCREQLDSTRFQLEEAKREALDLDRRLPQGGGPVTVRLRTAQDRLAALERLLPLEEQQQVARRETKSIHQRAEEARQQLEATREEWAAALKEAALPDDFTPSKVKAVKDRLDHTGDLRSQQRKHRKELEEALSSYEEFRQRLRPFVEELGLKIPAGKATDQLGQLANELRQTEEVERRLAELKGSLNSLRRREADATRDGKLWLRRRRSVLQAAGAQGDDELRRFVANNERRAVLIRQREDLEREINASFPDEPTKQAVTGLLEKTAAEPLQTLRGGLQRKLKDCEDQLLKQYEKRAELDHELKSLVKNRDAAAARFELSVVEAKIETAVHRWRVISTGNILLDRVRAKYEAEKQPAALKRASKWLTRMTDGRYTRIWTPLGDDTLKVDSPGGKTAPVEVLSRGTREQIFLALRLALVETYAEDGKRLPLVLDDVLVNFDTDRARSAAAVLKEFAADGHQLLVFTCHEHVAEMFVKLQAPVRKLPDAGSTVVTWMTAPAEKPAAPPKIKLPPPPKPLKIAPPPPARKVEGFKIAPPPPPQHVKKGHPRPVRKAHAPAAIVDRTAVGNSQLLTPLAPTGIVEADWNVMEPAVTPRKPERRPRVILSWQSLPALAGEPAAAPSPRSFVGKLIDVYDSPYADADDMLAWNEPPDRHDRRGGRGNDAA